MPRPKKPKIRANSEGCFEDVLQWAMNLTVRNVNEAQNSINLVDKSVEAEDVTDLTKLVKERNDAIKIQQNSAKILVDLSKLLSSHMATSKNKDSDDETVMAGALTPEDRKFAMKLAQEMKDNKNNDS